MGAYSFFVIMVGIVMSCDFKTVDLSIAKEKFFSHEIHLRRPEVNNVSVICTQHFDMRLRVITTSLKKVGQSLYHHKRQRGESVIPTVTNLCQSVTRSEARMQG